MQHNITCPHCGEAFTIDEAEGMKYAVDRVKATF